MKENVGRRERNKQRSRQAIMDAAVQVFGQKGFREASVANIMNAADMGVGTFYNYFQSKEDVLVALLDGLVRDVDRALDEGRSSNRSSLELLEAGCMVTAKFLEKNRYVLPLFMSASERSALPDGDSSDMRNITPGFKTVFEEILRQGQQAGEIRRDMPAELIAEMFHSLYQAASFSQLKLTFQENVRLKTILLIDGIRASKHITVEKNG